MRIKTKIGLNEYVKLMYTLTYRKWTMKLSTAMGLLLFLFVLMNFADLIEASETLIFPIVFSLLILFVTPISIYYSSKKNYKTHTRLHEEITYEISEKDIKVSGDSFTSEMTWDKIYKVVEMKKWFLIYQNKQAANIIPKNSIGKEIEELREIVRNQKIKSKLRNN